MADTDLPNGLGALPIHKYFGGSWGVLAASDVTTDLVCRVTYNAGAGAYRITSTPTLFVPQSIGGAGYSTIPGGGTPIRMQWGNQNLGGSGTAVPITFPIAFSSAPYSIQITGIVSTDRPLYVSTFSATGFTMVNPSTGITNTGYWLAIGPA